MPRQMKSYEMLAERFKEKYFSFYQELYDSEKGVLDKKTKELISLAVSLAAGCKGCFKGHVTKAARNGATREEVGEAIAIAVAINAAAIVDQTDIANIDYDLVHKLWENPESFNDNEADEELTP